VDGGAGRHGSTLFSQIISVVGVERSFSSLEMFDREVGNSGTLGPLESILLASSLRIDCLCCGNLKLICT
jgi:hypothetical protein